MWACVFLATCALAQALSELSVSSSGEIQGLQSKESKATACGDDSGHLRSQLDALIASTAKLRRKSSDLRAQLQQAATSGSAAVALTMEERPYTQPVCIQRDPHTDPTGRVRLLDTFCANIASMHVVNASAANKCRSGLPFFRMKSNALSIDMCFEWCLSMGMDIFGIAGGNECRCTASLENKGVWGDTPVHHSLVVDLEGKPPDGPDCAGLVAARFLGLENGQTPAALLHVGTKRARYIQSIVHQSTVNTSHAVLVDETDDGEEDGYSLVKDGEGLVNGRCKLGATGCSALALHPKSGHHVEVAVWLQDTESVGRGSEYTALRNHTMNAFRIAMRRIEAASCIRFIETQPEAGWDSGEWQWGVHVGKKRNDDGCYASTSKHGPGRQVYINLGWCDTAASTEVMAEKMMHALGLPASARAAPTPARRKQNAHRDSMVLEPVMLQEEPINTDDQEGDPEGRLYISNSDKMLFNSLYKCPWYDTAEGSALMTSSASSLKKPEDAEMFLGCFFAEHSEEHMYSLGCGLADDWQNKCRCPSSMKYVGLSLTKSETNSSQVDLACFWEDLLPSRPGLCAERGLHKVGVHQEEQVAISSRRHWALYLNPQHSREEHGVDVLLGSPAQRSVPAGGTCH
mmetsp:Transcript_22649/g.51791  ORF Transcript_22649/g.51791 Transcript_22649/m.51791 type:complete len:631 (-) Transcript_22649:29-1921(-)